MLGHYHNMMKLITTAAMLVCAVSLTAQVPPTAVFTKGEDGIDTYRIPAIVKAGDGTLLAFAEARRNSASDTGDIDLVLKRSSDGGRTWSAAITVWDDDENVCGNPSPVVDRNTGRIILLSTWNKGSDTEKKIHARTSKDTRRIYVQFSDDNGMSWSVPKEITDQVKLPEWTWYATGPCHSIQLRSGRILVPCNHGVFEDGPAGTHSHVVYSDDHGETWHIGGDAGTGNESTVTELSNGDVMLNMRGTQDKDRELSGYARIVAISHDGGLSFDAPYWERQLIEPVCNASICNFSKGAKPSRHLAFSNPCDGAKRRNMTLQVSPDNGRTWTKASILSTWPSAYSDVVMMGDGSVGVLYENGKKGPYEKISFVTVSKKQVRKALKKAR